MSSVRFDNVVKTFGSVTALNSINLSIQEGEFLTLLGPSGCGKTTTLRLIAGFILPSAGEIYLGDMEITHLPPQKRNVGMVFQDYALFPHMTVAENIGFALTERRVDKQTIRERVRELLDLVKLPGVEDRFPAQMSGGQQQRIAVARAVAHTPRVLLMDEPLGALDLKLRESMQIELRRIQQELGITAVYVTHDQSEAMSMSDRIVVMNHGAIEQIGTAAEIYQVPKTRFVADFIGQINFLDGHVIGDEGEWAVVETSAGQLRARRGADALLREAVTIALRPEKLALSDAMPQGNGADGLGGRIADQRFAGNVLKVFVDVGTEAPMIVEIAPGQWNGEKGDAVFVTWKREDVTLLAE